MSNDTFVSPLDLGADLLDYYVAKAVGITPIGYAMCRPCPESGYPEIADDQRESTISIRGVSKRLVYVKNCLCEDLKADKDMVKHWRGLYGHHEMCLGIVPQYAGVDAEAAAIVIWEHGISLLRTFKVSGGGMEWRAAPEPKCPGERHYSIGHESPVVAGLRVLVQTKIPDVLLKVPDFMLEPEGTVR